MSDKRYIIDDSAGRYFVLDTKKNRETGSEPQEVLTLLKQRDDLLYACERALAYLDKHRRGDDLITATALQNAIAQAKGQ